MVGGYFLLVENEQDGIRIGGSGNQKFPQSDFQSLEVKKC
jgi:hypothetical protein